MIRKGDQVWIRPECQDPGDERFEWRAMDDEEKGRVTISPVNIGLPIPPLSTVDVTMLETRPPGPTEAEVEAALEEAGVDVHKPTTQDNIEALQQRLDQVQARRIEWSDAARKNEAESFQSYCAERMTALRREAATLQARIQEFEAQRKGRN